MSSIIQKLEALTVNESERSNLIGYLTRTKKSKKYFRCRNDYVVIPSFDAKKYLLCKMIRSFESLSFLCLECQNATIFENMNDVEKFVKTKTNQCVHEQLCEVLFHVDDAVKEVLEDSYVEVLHKSNKENISLVHPPIADKKKSAGIVIINRRTSKPKCHTCERKKCIHINLYKHAGEKCETNNDEDIVVKKLEANKKPSSNPFDASRKKGKESNVFGISINYPPSRCEKINIDKINNVDTLFPDGYAIPDVTPGECCKCGNEFVTKVEMGNCESTNMIIHHSNATKDSRNSSLIVLFRRALGCNCVKNYLGKEHNLLRISGISGRGTQQQNHSLHFISYDFLFEYHASLMAGGTTQNSFVQSKNDMNYIVRGQENRIPPWIFRKGYEIFIHALVYEKDKAWNCTDCPKPILTGSKEKEEAFEDVEVHISDGINMGTLENDIKGFTEKDIFEEEKDESVVVKGIEAKDRTFLNTIKQRNILKDLGNSEMKESDVKNAISKLKKCAKSKHLGLVQDLL